MPTPNPARRSPCQHLLLPLELPEQPSPCLLPPDPITVARASGVDHPDAAAPDPGAAPPDPDHSRRCCGLLITAEKITPRHQERRAYVYVRQSSLQHVLPQRESQRHQDALVERAVALGWQASARAG